MFSSGTIGEGLGVVLPSPALALMQRRLSRCGELPAAEKERSAAAEWIAHRRFDWGNAIILIETELFNKFWISKY